MNSPGFSPRAVSVMYTFSVSEVTTAISPFARLIPARSRDSSSVALPRMYGNPSYSIFSITAGLLSTTTKGTGFAANSRQMSEPILP
jgi:hypothetical protein